jgi:hypothetical protein
MISYQTIDYYSKVLFNELVVSNGIACNVPTLSAVGDFGKLNCQQA